MALIVVEHEGDRWAAFLPKRVLIGRKSMNQLVIEHRAVSRLHSWIDRLGGEGRTERHAVTDAGSRTGTKVNGEPVRGRRELADGDVITIGPIAMTYRTGSAFPPGVEVLELPAEPVVLDEEKGVLFNCRCGAPLWAGMEFCGHVGQCQYCGRELIVPYRHATDKRPPVVSPGEAAKRRGFELQVSERDEAAAPVESIFDAPATPEIPGDTLSTEQAPLGLGRGNPTGEYCGVCQSSIGQFEERTLCPACGLTFHAECWAENYGCSAYGCSQVNVLKPPDDPPAVGTDAGEPGGAEESGASVAGDEPVARQISAVPWEFLLLAGSVFAALLGAVTFGLPSLAVAGGSAAWFARHRGGGQRRSVVLLAGALAVVGVVTGVAVSWVLYFGGRRMG